MPGLESYGSLDTGTDTTIEMSGAASVVSIDLGPTIKSDYLRKDRMLTCYQVLLVLACMIFNIRLFESMGWLAAIDVFVCAQQPAQGANAVSRLPDAFNVDARGLTS